MSERVLPPHLAIDDHLRDQAEADQLPEATFARCFHLRRFWSRRSRSFSSSPACTRSRALSARASASETYDNGVLYLAYRPQA